MFVGQQVRCQGLLQRKKKAARNDPSRARALARFSVVATVLAANVAANVASGDIGNTDAADPMTTCTTIFADHC